VAGSTWLPGCMNASPINGKIATTNSHRLVAENDTLVWSKDYHQGMAPSFGKSVASASHAQLRSMLAYKCTASGRRFLGVPSQCSTQDLLCMWEPLWSHWLCRLVSMAVGVFSVWG
jgi:hypothetical protein